MNLSSPKNARLRAAVREELAARDGEVLDVEAVAALLKLGRNAVYDACARGEIPHRRIGKSLRFSKSAILNWLAPRADPTAPNRR